MGIRFLIAGSALAALTLCTSAAAQDAAETAVILSGTGSGQAKASRDLGNAISGSIGGAANTVRAASRPAQPRRQPARRQARGNAVSAHILPEGVDALEGTDAPSYRLGNGTTIRVSGDFTPSPQTRCDEHCPQRPED